MNAGTISAKVESDRFESCAVLRLAGAPYLGGRVERGRIVLQFGPVEPRHLEALRAFESGVGPRANLARYAEALRWVKDEIFNLRRRNGLEAGR